MFLNPAPSFGPDPHVLVDGVGVTIPYGHFDDTHVPAALLALDERIGQEREATVLRSEAKRCNGCLYL